MIKIKQMKRHTDFIKSNKLKRHLKKEISQLKSMKRFLGKKKTKLSVNGNKQFNRNKMPKVLKFKPSGITLLLLMVGLSV